MKRLMAACRFMIEWKTPFFWRRRVSLANFVGGHFALGGVEEAGELLVSVTLHVAADHRAIAHVERGKQRGRAVALVVVPHGCAAVRAAAPAGYDRAPESGFSC